MNLNLLALAHKLDRPPTRGLTALTALQARSRPNERTPRGAVGRTARLVSSEGSFDPPHPLTENPSCRGSRLVPISLSAVEGM